MSDTPRCEDMQALAPELALGLLTGFERAGALAHLETCAACRAEVESLAATVDDLLLAVPPLEPPAGFESGVLERLETEVEFAPFPRQRSAVRRVMALAAVLFLLFAGVAIGRFGHHGASKPAVEVLQMTTPAGVRVGRVELGRDPGSLFVALPGWASDAWNSSEYFLRVRFDDGHSTSLGPIAITATKPTWGSLTTFDPASVRDIAMVDGAGHVYCSTQLV